MTPEQQISEYLKDLPSKWRDQLTKLLCEIKASKVEPTCTQVKNCETVTSLSEFYTDGSDVCVQYVDEKGISHERCFNLTSAIDASLGDLEPGCLTDIGNWNSMTFAEKIQLLINSHCDCCD